MSRHNIPTAQYGKFHLIRYKMAMPLEQMKPPYVLKADGLAAGKEYSLSMI